jgi:hypothetical protein
MDLSIIIPCYNEVENVPKIQREFFPIATKLAKSHSPHWFRCRARQRGGDH